MQWSFQQCVQATLLYASLFEYPLTAREIYKYLIVPYKQKPPRFLTKQLSVYPHSQSLYAMLDPQKLAQKRTERYVWSQKKWKIVYTLLPQLSKIPTLLLIGVSGSVAMNNAGEDDDVDLFFICAPGTIWISRLCVMCVLAFNGKLRRFGNLYQKDLCCPNMFIVSDRMRTPRFERSIYTAHEVIQMKPVWSLSTTAVSFFHQNSWVRHVLPYGYRVVVKDAQEFASCKPTLLRKMLCFFFSLLNSGAKTIQLLYMRPHRTTEVISDSVLRFHPRDQNPLVKNKFLLLLQEKNIPLDSRFF